MGRLTTHVLDTALGKPAAGLAISLRRAGKHGAPLATVVTNKDGRADQPLLDGSAMEVGSYELVFEAGAYFDRLGLSLPSPKFLDQVVIRFGIDDPGAHYHVPLLLSPYGYSTYRGQLMPIRFMLGDEERALDGVSPTLTVLEYLRRHERRMGTKEGCAEGDCGACTVVLSEPDGEGGLKHRSVNSCIQFVSVLHGRQLTTVEDLKAPDGALHPVQQALVDKHGSQCGFCTPGFVMQLYAAWLGGVRTDRQAVKDWIAGNLCRCTGYGPIVDAGVEVLKNCRMDRSSDEIAARKLGRMADGGMLHVDDGDAQLFAPRTADELAEIYLEYPDAVLVSGGTDVGLWVTKQRRHLKTLIDITRVKDLAEIDESGSGLTLGATVSLRTAAAALSNIHHDLGELMRRFASIQIRNAGTVGGNIANGSPIGDLPPALIALDARLTLRRGIERREIPIEDFFIAYGKQDRAPGEFVESVWFSRLSPRHRFACYKLSKRFDQDISAVMGAFRVTYARGKIIEARLAFGGMAATPKRATQAETALMGSAFDVADAEAAVLALVRDFTPLSDMRASSGYRLKAAQNLLRRFQIETNANHDRDLWDKPATRVLDLA